MISEWAIKFNTGIKAAVVNPGQTYYKIKDIFTTRDGSWELSNTPGSIPDWARALYLRPYNAPDYFDDGGGDRHNFGAIVDRDTSRTLKDPAIAFRYYTWTDNANSVLLPIKPKSGWANNLMSNWFSPDLDANAATGERGAWAWYPEYQGKPAETFLGGGLPFKWHVSFFVTWVLATAGDTEPPKPDEELVARMKRFEDWAVAVSKANPEEPQYEPV